MLFLKSVIPCAGTRCYVKMYKQNVHQLTRGVAVCLSAWEDAMMDNQIDLPVYLLNDKKTTNL